MKSKIKTEKQFDTVKTFREIKDKISNEIKGMNFDQFNAYLDDKTSKNKTYCQKQA